MFAGRLNGLCLPDRGVVKAFFLEGVEVVPVGAGFGNNGEDGVGQDDGEGAEVRPGNISPSVRVRSVFGRVEMRSVFAYRVSRSVPGVRLSRPIDTGPSPKLRYSSSGMLPR